MNEISCIEIVKTILFSNSESHPNLVIQTIENNNEANWASVSISKKRSDRYHIDFRKNHLPRRTFKEISLKEISLLINMYCGEK
jgi:hypothetical protein